MSAEHPLQFVDTNILVYAHDQTAGEKQQRAIELLEKLWESDSGCLSVQVLQEFFVTITAKVKKPLESSQAAEVVSVLANWKVHSPEARDVLRAIEIQARSRISFWDAMIVCSASKLGCEVMWTEDLNPDQVYEGVKVRNPFI